MRFRKCDHNSTPAAAALKTLAAVIGHSARLFCGRRRITVYRLLGCSSFIGPKLEQLHGAPDHCAPDGVPEETPLRGVHVAQRQPEHRLGHAPEAERQRI